MEDPVVNVKYSEYSKMREEARTQQARIYELEKELAEAKVADNSGTTKLLHEALHEALKVVQFAVGNLAPETVSGWPHKALVAVADAVDKLPAIDQHIAEVPSEWRNFARTAANYEEYRRQRDANKVVTMATAADFGPKTPEAAAVHAALKSSTAEAEPSAAVAVDTQR